MSRYPFLVLPLLLHSSMLPQVVRSQINGNARSCSCHQRCPAAAVQQMPTRATSHSDTSNWLSPPQPLLPDRQSHCSAFSSAAVRGDTATARACSSRSGEDGSTGGHHAARRQGQQERLCFARACARLVPVERGAGRPAGRSGQGGWVVICPTASDRATALRCRLCAAMSTGGISLRRSRLRARRAATTRCAVCTARSARGAGRPAGRSGQGRVGRDLSDGKRSCDSAAVSARTAASAAVSSSKDTTSCTVCAPPRAAAGL